MQRYNDEELLYLSRQGCIIAYQYLYQQCLQYTKMMIKKTLVFNNGYLDSEDFIQLAMIGCFKAFDNYRPDKDCLLRTFMMMVIRNNIINTLKKNQNDKKKYGNTLSLDEQVYDGNYRYDELVGDSKIAYQPKEKLLVKEKMEYYQANVLSSCSSLEKEVMVHKMNGYSNQDIAYVLNIEIKAVYNAIYRLQKKTSYLKSI